MSEIKLEYSDDDEKILIKRTESLAKNVELEENYHERVEFLTFRINNVRYALETNFIQEVYSDISPVKVPCTPDFIKGIVNIRGEILSITDLSLFLGNKPINSRNHYQMIRIKQQKLEFGILVDEIEDILFFSQEDIHSFALSDNRADKYIKGVSKNMINILNIEYLLSDDQIIVNDNII